MRKRSHPLIIYRRVKEQWLLRPLLVSAPHAIPHQTSPPTYTQRLAPYPCHASFLPVPTHSPPPTIARTPKVSNFLCCPLQPLASSPAILLLHAFDQLISSGLKPTFLSPASFGELVRKPVQASCSTEQKVIGQGVVSIPQRVGGKRTKTEGSLRYIFL